MGCSLSSGAKLTLPGGERASGLTEFDLGYYGWRVVLAACLGVMAGFGSLFVYTFTVFVKPLSAAFGWNREAISLGFGLAAITLGAISPLLGRWIDRFGPRRIILPCMTVFGCAIASLALLRSGVWQFYVTCVVLGLVGNGAAHLAYSRSISTWFERRLGTALAFVMVGAGLGAMILPVVAQAIISRAGWRVAYLSLGGLALLLGLPLSWRYVFERGSGTGAGAGRSKTATVEHAGKTWQEGLRSYVFWIIVAVLFVSSISMNGAITHLSALLTDRGITPGDAALCASVLGGSEFTGKDWGWLAAGPIFWGTRGAGGEFEYRGGDLCAGTCKQFCGGMRVVRADRNWCGRGSGDYAVFADTLFWATRVFHAVRADVDVLRGGGRDWPGDFGARV